MKKTVSRIGSLALTTALVAAGAAATTTPADAASAAAKYRVTLQVSENDVVADQDELVLTGRVYPTPGPAARSRCSSSTRARTAGSRSAPPR